MQSQLILLFLPIILAEQWSAHSPVSFIQDMHIKMNKVGFEPQEKQWLLMFYAPWCPHCKTLIPTWEKLAREYKNIYVGAVDCTVETELCSRFSIRGYPSLILIDHNNMMYQYKGERSFEKLSTFVDGGYSLQEGQAVPLKADKFKEIREQFSQPHVLVSDRVLSIFTIALIIVCIMDYKENKKEIEQEEKQRKEKPKNE